jgi:hypothetical protein
MHLKTPLLLTLLFLAAGEAAATTLTATPAKLTQSDREITIRWSDLPDPDGLDHVAIYSPPSSRDRNFLGYLFLKGSASWVCASVPPLGRCDVAEAGRFWYLLILIYSLYQKKYSSYN